METWSPTQAGNTCASLVIITVLHGYEANSYYSWLNEGWTVYLERRIQSAIHGEAEFDFSSIIGWKALGSYLSTLTKPPFITRTNTKTEDAVELFGKDHEYTKLIISHKDVDPEDVYSTVAYEKGFHFLYYLDGLVGREAFDKFIPHYFTKWSGKSLDSFEFRDTFMDYFNGLGDETIKQKIATIDWEGRFYTPGLPPKPDFDLSMVTACYELATKWQDAVSNRYTPSHAQKLPVRLTHSSLSSQAQRTYRPSPPTRQSSSSTSSRSPVLCLLSEPSFSAKYTTSSPPRTWSSSLPTTALPWTLVTPHVCMALPNCSAPWAA